MKELTLVIPAKDEAECLPRVLDELKNFDCKIIMQNDDGFGSALIQGIKEVETNFLCIFNADGSFDPKYLKNMFNELSNNYDFVFNSRYENGTVNMNEEINVSIAIAMEDGLIMPSIINCNDLDIKQLSISSKDLVDRTKNGKLTSAEYTKGTFSISNLGMFDVNSFLAIIFSYISS